MLYDQYGAMAYGVITQIIPEPDIAQTLLINLFASSQVLSLPDSPAQTACAIVRMARLKALEAMSAESMVPASFGPQPGPNDNLPKLVFDLSFTKGFKLEAIAERLGMTCLDVQKAMREHIKSMRTR